jgi:hypothetical protein
LAILFPSPLLLAMWKQAELAKASICTCQQRPRSSKQVHAHHSGREGKIVPLQAQSVAPSQSKTNRSCENSDADECVCDDYD